MQYLKLELLRPKYKAYFRLKCKKVEKNLYNKEHELLLIYFTRNL